MREVSPTTPFRAPLQFLFGALAAVAMAGGVYAVAQHRINGLDARVAEIERSRLSDRELLVRIDERTAEIKRQLDASRP